MTAPLYKPPTKVTTISIPLKVLVVRQDPDFERLSRFEPFYEFSNGRCFIERTSIQGPYAP